MIRRQAIFTGQIRPDMWDDMCAYVKTDLVSLWRQFHGATDVHVLFNQDPASEVPLILSVDYPDQNAIDQAMDSPARYESRDLLPAFYERFFDHVTLTHYQFDII